jgi:CRP-like cAMP-binding protein
VLKKTEIFDVEGVLQRTDTIEQLSRQLQQAQEQLKKMGGDMQTRDRENVNLKQRVEVEKFKAGLDKISNRAQSAGTLYERRLDDATSEMASELRRTRKEAG